MRTYPPVGQKWLFDIGMAQIEHHFESERRMHYKIVSGPHRLGEEETVAIETLRVAPDIYMVSWQECDGSTVVHVEDYARNIFYACAVLPDRKLMRVQGAMRRIKSFD